MKSADASAAVTFLKLSCNNLLPEHASAIVQHLTCFSSLVNIDISSNRQLSDSGLEAFLSALSGKLTSHLIACAHISLMLLCCSMS